MVVFGLIVVVLTVLMVIVLSISLFVQSLRS
jgi:Flp pilus assembly pilin Flp